MLLNEVFKFGYLIESEETIKNAVLDLILQLTAIGEKTAKLDDFIVELNNIVPTAYLNYQDKSTQDLVTRLIRDNTKARVDAGIIFLEPKSKNDKDNPGEEFKKDEEKEQEKIQKIASKRVKQRSSGEL